ncbi:CIS tube protein [Acrocarpospora catenulata]|uniref:CIS tube protein n=1 Tax=Acrocarpospora catenulata TaxID=2836182 RepID=UPI001BDA3EC5|nr:LysM peptidoglycan-binding domain-containing protein [Acrocarpospora catenulata]
MAVQLAKALIVDTRTGERVAVMYNPEEYRVEQGNELAEIGVPGLAASPVQYVRGRTRTLTMDLFFDTYEQQIDVRAYTNRLVRLLHPAPRTFAPPVLLFVMGRFSFRCVLAEADQRFTMFLPDGTPVRARVSVTFREYTEVEFQTQRGFFAGPPTVHTTTDRDTLAGLAATYLGDPARWREIADANNLLDPLRLPAGRPLVIPER